MDKVVEHKQAFCNEFQKRMLRRLSEISSFPEGLVAQSVFEEAMTDVLCGYFTTETGEMPKDISRARAERMCPPIIVTRHVGMLEDPEEVAKEMMQYHTCGTCKHLRELFSDDEARDKQDFYMCAAVEVKPKPQAMRWHVLRQGQSGHWYVDCGPGRDPEYVNDCPAWEAKIDE